MTYRELYKTAVKRLSESESDSPEYEVRCLMEHFFGLDRISFITEADRTADKEEQEMFLAALEKRIGGFPLQYILGSWSFMDCCLSVGAGVLIPRDDTEVCVRECIRLIDEKKLTAPVIIDLCSGSGAIAIALAKKYPKAHIYAAELSDKAFSYLCENIEQNEVGNVYAVNKDIGNFYGSFEDGFFDVIISNPPYIKSNEIPSLQREVQFEPEMALDGGKDGLSFYRIIAEKWLPKLRSGGIVSLEIGEEQGEAVRNLLLSSGIEDVRVIKDIQGMDRAAAGIRK
ncbi:MAG: peptide chain release factor N(5)-glutamine methyltransferase [Clostridia bacterium]|nr:peptide chain release factor N(5)-glutamine methyltransferase [Clostridia bacterium]